MFAKLREDWEQLKAGAPGRRFQDLNEYRRDQHHHTKKTHVLRLIAAGVLLVLGPIAGLIPGPGGCVFFAAGLMLLASEMHPAAKALDATEKKLRAVWQRVRGKRAVPRQ